jgi:ABC-type transporter Mla subunit MlaD
MVSLFQTPLEIARAVSESVRALAELPAALERSLRGTTALIEDSRAQLALLGEQVQRMMDQLEKMATVTDRLLEGAQAITAAAHDAQRQMAQTSEQLAATNRSLEQIVRLAEPLDRAGKRLAEGLARVTGRGKPPSEPQE